MNKIEALKLALDAFGEIAWSNETQWQRDRAKEAITVIKEALANVATNDIPQERVDKTSENVHEPWSPVSIGVDMTEAGAHVIGIYALDNDTSQIFYAKFYPAPQQTGVDRNDTLEEVAQEFDKMPFGDTAASFARYVRDMKDAKTKTN